MSDQTDPTHGAPATASTTDPSLDRFRPPGADETVTAPLARVETAGAAHRLASMPPPTGSAARKPARAEPEARDTAAPSPTGPSSWDDWSHRDRDRRERRSLVLRVRAQRAASGFGHEHAVAASRSRIRAATAVTVVAALVLVPAWVLVIGARNAAIATGGDARTFAPAGFVVLLVTVLVVTLIVRTWVRVLRARPDRLVFAPLPDSAEAPRHGAFDGSTTPPRRW